MNERIRELWDLSRNPSGRGHDEQKFAESIVGECIAILADNSEFRGCVIIAKHFGVEE